MTIRPKGTRQTDLGYTPAEELPASTFEIQANPTFHEAAVYTGTQRRRPAGWLSHNELRGEIDTVYVSKQFRGKGLAGALYKAAGRPKHSTQLTEQGERFARRVGGEMPTEINREPPLHEAGHEEMLPDFARWISESPGARRVQ